MLIMQGKVEKKLKKFSPFLDQLIFVLQKPGLYTPLDKDWWIKVFLATERNQMSNFIYCCKDY